MYFSRWLLLGILGIAASVAGQTTMPVEYSLVHLPEGVDHVVMPLENAGALCMTKVSLDGKEAGWFMIDTGATVTMVDISVAERLKLVPTTSTEPAAGSVLKKSFRIGRLSCGGLDYLPVVVGGVDLHYFRSMMQFPLAGVLGGDLLGQLPFEINYPKRTLTIFAAATFSAPRGMEIPFRLVRGTPNTEITVEGYKVDADVDTGSMGSDLSPVVFIDHPRLIDGRPMWDSSSYDVKGMVAEYLCRFDPVSYLGHAPCRIWLHCTRNYNQDDKVQTVSSRIGGAQFRDACLTFDYRRKRMWAVWSPAPTTDEMLLQLGDPRGHDLLGETPLINAAGWGRTDVVTRLLERGADVGAANAFGQTALMTAADSDYADAELIRLLIAHGARTEISANVGGETALHYACQRFDVAVVKELLKAGADPNAANTHGWTPLTRAAEGTQLATADALLAAGADPLAAAKDGLTPLVVATRRPSAALLKAMLDKLGGRATIAATSVLGIASHDEQFENVKLLLDRGADPNVLDQYGRTPLMETGSAEIIQLLLERGADPNRLSTEGKTAWDYAAANDNLLVLRALRDPPVAKGDHR